MNKPVPQIKMSIFELGRSIIGRDDITSVKIIDRDGNVIESHEYKSNEKDVIPSVVFSLSDVLSPQQQVSVTSQEFLSSVLVPKFPGRI
jgi:hypothetical protein